LSSHEFGFEKLTVYQEARSLIREIYGVSKSFPSDERFGLTAQLNRAVVSVAANIAEGSSRISFKEQVALISSISQQSNDSTIQRFNFFEASLQ